MTRAEFLLNWTGFLKRMPIDHLDARKELLELMRQFFVAPLAPDEQEALEEMTAEVEDSIDFRMAQMRGQNPMAFWVPSLEQAMVLNAWHPAARQEGFRGINENADAPIVKDFLDYEGGYRSVGNYTCNRGGKTRVAVQNTNLWMIPQDPDWPMFQWHEDWLGRGRYRVLQRPDWEVWRRRDKMRYNGLSAPAKGACTIWHAVGRDDDWHHKVWLAYKEELPPDSYGVRDDGHKAVYKLEKRFVTAWGHEVIGMSMSAEADKFAGKAAWLINIDEGVTQDIFREIMTRIQAGGYFNQAYTPVDPANIGDKSLVAHRIYKREPGYELVGKSKFFVHFRMQDAPPWIIPEEKKQDDLRRWAGMGAEGRARAEGGFFNSAPLVFTNFKRELNILPWSADQVVRWIKGDIWPNESKDIAAKFYQANILRGFDEGIAHPSACSWVALLRTGEQVIYRTWEQSGLSIGARVDEIIQRSGNLKQLAALKGNKRPSQEEQALYIELLRGRNADAAREAATGSKIIRYREEFVREEIRATFADHKLYKKDPLHPLDNWSENYTRAGLRMQPSVNQGPAARCDYINELLAPDHTRKHLNPGQHEHGTRLYVLSECTKAIERFENYLFAQNKDASFTGQPVDEDDDTIDSFSFVCVARLRWQDPKTLAVRRGQVQNQAGLNVRR